MYVKYAIGVTNFKNTSGAGGCWKILCKSWRPQNSIFMQGKTDAEQIDTATD